MNQNNDRNLILRICLIVLAIYLVPGIVTAIAIGQSFVVGFAIALPFTTIFVIAVFAAEARRKE